LKTLPIFLGGYMKKNLIVVMILCVASYINVTAMGTSQGPMRRPGEGEAVSLYTQAVWRVGRAIRDSYLRQMIPNGVPVAYPDVITNGVPAEPQGVDYAHDSFAVLLPNPAAFN
jgi:hypothetical protein